MGARWSYNLIVLLVHMSAFIPKAIVSEALLFVRLVAWLGANNTDKLREREGRKYVGK